MTVRAYRRDTCRLCGGTQLELVLGLTPTPPADAYLPADRADETREVFPIDLMLCDECGFSQLADIVYAEDVYVDYTYVTSSSLGLDAHFDAYAGAVVDSVAVPPGSLVVDAGSNDGTLLRSFAARGMRVLGIDPAREVAALATASGVETLPEFLTAQLAERVRADRGPAAVVTANNVYANVDDLDEFTASVRGLLAADGVFVFESFYLSDLVRNMVFDFIYHEHLSYFTVAPLVAFFERHGMELIDVDHVPTKGGSLRYTVQLAGGPRPVAPAVAEYVAAEQAQGVHAPALFADFDRRITAAKDAVWDVLAPAKERGEHVAGFGASATTTTLLHHFDMGGTVEFLVDEFEVKQGRVSPGLHIPVSAPEELLCRQPEWLFITAWRYFDPIKEKTRTWAEAGGRYIVPLPELVVE